MTVTMNLPSSTNAESSDPIHRIAALLDACSLRPLLFSGEGGVMVARGTARGVPVIVFATDPRVMGGAIGAADCDRIVTAIGTALAERLPVVGIWQSGGARLNEGLAALDGVSRVFAAKVRASGRIPQISVLVGPSAGGAAHGPALDDVVIMAKAGRILVTGPDAVRSVTGEDVSMESLGGPDVHERRSGVAHVVAADAGAAFREARDLIRLLGAQGIFEPEAIRRTSDPGAFLPEQAQRAYDVKPLIKAILDDSDWSELQPRWAANVVTGLGRLAGRTIGVVANNPIREGGCLDSLSAEKSAWFVRLCDAMGIPLLVLVDVPGYLPGADQEGEGVVRRAAKLLHAFADCSVPRVTLVTRKAYGDAYVAMNSRGLGASAVFAWPGARVAVMGAAPAVELPRRGRDTARPDHPDASCAELVAEHERTAGGVAHALEIGVVDEVIEPAGTPDRLVRAFAEAPLIRGDHTNIPL
ncbi:acyl-CoA carboxylase subunit beta [Actinoplanes aureus]|uniref:Acyl-CoA carboxylase subunit beta n=1 Tax=Actinoplanes aureus TaxID=2792083 RepID=A0A931G1D2_9ACTN|nr:carboxyl transferase domain-containing protein [Actinoplanes aureus]MBG0567763.1 acyl-CoA carboxylase subunit beta [Actinoplanes aureus]